ncbi:DUF302 domain-containing protein [Neoroseomonas lacus]|uniref:DUF302 domain-containing protein n=1 Tax=Neoroseomonas lacus TaxID=287609 RepID=A0A917NYU9_9PROT|nr:DUF302 domain-containing protein [Neoroseomonas lacus]GGJ41689.1 hypothetical protein GCM10011320_56540 [Neoroseomonas lacus]
MRRIVLALTFSFSASLAAVAQDSGVLTRPSAHDFATTLSRLEASMRQEGFRVFGRLDHAEGAREVGLAMPPSTVVVFGNPRAGTPNFLRQPTLALDLPLRALVWQDQAGKVSVSWNSARYLFGTIYPRHGLTPAEGAAAAPEAAMARIMERAVE